MKLKGSGIIVFLLILAGLCGCSNRDEKKVPGTLFAKVSSDSSGVKFINRLTFDSDFNIYTYRNFYNGGGVGLGDFNNDGLLDIYFTSNQQANKLYINKGDFRFEDITEKAGVGGTRAWSTGVSLADVNADGWTDIYVCNSGDVKGDDRENELFINNGDLTFTERAGEYGVADKGFSTHSIFFDYDKDGDLDLYILNNSYQSIGSFNLRKNERGKRDLLGGHKLMRNDNGHFVDVSESAGIFGSVIAFGLGVTVGDINKDSWLDIYVSNDFFERDYLYINNGNGTFRECLPTAMKSITGASMGADLADINNDALPDLFVTEMLPRRNDRVKTVTTFENWDRYQYGVSNDYHHQFTRNTLQVNNDGKSFSEIGRFAQVEATDWSWGALIFDADNDGFKDIFVASGIYQDLTNQDFLQYAASEEVVRMVVSKNQVDYKKLVEIIPSTPVPNHFFKNHGNLKFTDESATWIGEEVGFSNGSAYGDLDNDGDLDLVVNRVNQESSVYKNRSREQNPGNHYLKFILHGENGNKQALGTNIRALHNGKEIYLEQMPMRGFESTVDFRPNMGVGSLTFVEKVIIEWPDGRITELDSARTDQVIEARQEDATRAVPGKSRKTETVFSTLENASLGVDFSHQENDFIDFDRDRLIYHMVSTEGPKVSVADVNKDGRDDFYIGGPKGQAGALFMQGANGRFTRSNESVFKIDEIAEDLSSEFFDADGDEDMDLYVCAGGNEFPPSSSALLDRLYFNDGKGNFTKSAQLLPSNDFTSTSTVRPADFDGDGDVDLFVGARLLPFSYGTPVDGYLLANDGKGNFTDLSPTIAPALKKLGLITDSSWADVDGDKDPDLIVVGEWMGVKVFTNNNGRFELSGNSMQSTSEGWWNCIEAADLDKDGDTDLVLGNHGLNSRFRASAERPVTMWVSDFDRNGTVEQVITTYSEDKDYPMVLRHDLITQLPQLKKQFLKYEDYKDATINDIFTPDQLTTATKVKVTNLASSIMLNDGTGKFTLTALPVEAQLTPIYGILIEDIDKDGNLDLLMGGNLYRVKPEAGRYDAGYGTFLKGDGKGNFACVLNRSSGLYIDGEVRDIKVIRIGMKDVILVTRNNDTPVFLNLK